ncbi:hypothetical protein SRHO_G00266460, partial [Serrasalmus rhombeus]
MWILKGNSTHFSESLRNTLKSFRVRRSGSFVEKLADSDVFTVVVMGTRRRRDYNTDIDTLFTIQNHQRTYTSLLSLYGMLMMENSGKSGIMSFLWGLFCRTAPCM